MKKYLVIRKYIVDAENEEEARWDIDMLPFEEEIFEISKRTYELYEKD